MCPGNHSPGKNSFKCGVITDLTAFPHFNLNSRKSAERSSEGMRSKLQSPQAVMDLQATSSRLEEQLHVVLQTLQGSKDSRTGWATSLQIIPLRIIKYRKPTDIQKATGLKVENERDGKILGDVIIVPFYKKHSFGQYRRQDAEIQQTIGLIQCRPALLHTFLEYWIP